MLTGAAIQLSTQNFLRPLYRPPGTRYAVGTKILRSNFAAKYHNISDSLIHTSAMRMVIFMVTHYIHYNESVLKCTCFERKYS